MKRRTKHVIAVGFLLSFVYILYALLTSSRIRSATDGQKLQGPPASNFLLDNDRYAGRKSNALAPVLVNVGSQQANKHGHLPRPTINVPTIPDNAGLKKEFNRNGHIIVRDKKMLICLIPKAGSTQLKRLGLKLLGYKDYLHIRDPHNTTLYEPLLEHLPPEEVEEVLLSEDYLRLVVVRNPYTRILSGYLDKLVHGHGLNFDPIPYIYNQRRKRLEIQPSHGSRSSSSSSGGTNGPNSGPTGQNGLEGNFFQRTGRYIYGALGSPNGQPGSATKEGEGGSSGSSTSRYIPPFADFVAAVTNRKDRFNNHHFARQSSLCGIGKYSYHYMIRFESIYDDLLTALSVREQQHLIERGWKCGKPASSTTTTTNNPSSPATPKQPPRKPQDPNDCAFLQDRTGHATGATSAVDRYYTPEIRDKVRAYFLEDFQRFGYDTRGVDVFQNRSLWWDPDPDH